MITNVQVFDEVAGVYDTVLPFFAELGRQIVGVVQPVPGTRLLDLGAGRGAVTGPALARGALVTAVDAAPGMVARLAADHPGATALLMDAQHLDFPDSTFDTVLATFVFCSVPDPVRGLRELRRVVKPDGKILLLEHVRPRGTAGTATDIVNPAVVRIWGANINRCTVENVQDAGLVVDHVDNLLRDFVKLIVASPGK